MTFLQAFGALVLVAVVWTGWSLWREWRNRVNGPGDPRRHG